MTTLGNTVTIASGNYNTSVSVGHTTNNPFKFTGTINAFNPLVEADPQIGLDFNPNDLSLPYAPINWTVTNTGSITGGQYGVRVYTGTITNSGFINGATGSGIGLLTAGTVVNSGTVEGQGQGVVVRNGGSVSNINSGKIFGIQLAQGGSVSNASGAVIQNAQIAIAANGTALTVVNAGRIFSTGTDTSSGNRYYGISSVHGGSVTNAVAATITSSGTAVALLAAASTVVNAGSIGGGTAAVYLGAGFANRLVVDPGAVFSGTVNGGNTLGAATGSTLELATGATTGTLSGIGSKYIHFANLAVDSGTSWVLGAGNAIAAGYSVTDSGTLTKSG